MWFCRFLLIAITALTLTACGVDEKEAIAQAKRQETAIVAVLEAETQLSWKFAQLIFLRGATANLPLDLLQPLRRLFVQSELERVGLLPLVMDEQAIVP